MNESNQRASVLDAPTIVGTSFESSCGRSESIDSGFPSIDGYEIIREIGRGGMGIVYLAKQCSLNRLVALKTMHSQGDQKSASLLLSEAQIVAGLNHPSIVPVFEVNTTGNVWYFSMGFVPGDNLARRLSRSVMSVQEVVRLAVTLCEALEYSHQNGVLHLDIKPANILLDKGDIPKLTDFGLSATHESSVGDRQIIGTPQYMAPEQAFGEKEEITPASDIYSLGAVMYSALVGRPPIVSANQEDLVLKVVSQPPVPFRQLGIKIARPLEAIIYKCLQKKSSNRYQSSRELRDDLEAFRSGRPVKARPPSVFASCDYLLRRHLFAASVSGTLVVLLLLLLGALVAKIWTQARDLTDLRTEIDGLVRISRMQVVLSHGGGGEQSIAMELSNQGVPDQAAYFAALAIQRARAKQMPVDTNLLSLIDEYLIRHPTKSSDSENSDKQLERILGEITARQEDILMETSKDKSSPK